MYNWRYKISVLREGERKRKEEREERDNGGGTEDRKIIKRISCFEG